MSPVYQRGGDVLWNPVGRDPDELLLVHEGQDTRIFVLSGRTGAAVWTRLDGARSLDDLSIELARECGTPLEDARNLIASFVRELQAEGLVELLSRPSPSRACDPLPWPADPEPPALAPFSSESLAAPDLVAVGSYQGGHNNIGHHKVCHAGAGGFNNQGGPGPCRPGHGWNNSGHGPKCN
ncbi:MAG: PqqD family protein [Deltaproteobacteria bacterium]|nr:PqqD family protein [Deltaproteobacteria bacterium]